MCDTRGEKGATFHLHHLTRLVNEHPTDPFFWGGGRVVKGERSSLSHLVASTLLFYDKLIFGFSLSLSLSRCAVHCPQILDGYIHKKTPRPRCGFESRCASSLRSHSCSSLVPCQPKRAPFDFLCRSERNKKPRLNMQSTAWHDSTSHLRNKPYLATMSTSENFHSSQGYTESRNVKNEAQYSRNQIA